MERKQHDQVRERFDAAHSELQALKAQVNAHAGIATRLQRAEAELGQTRAAAREEAARLRGQAEALKTQNGELMEALKLREPKGGKRSPT